MSESQNPGSNQLTQWKAKLQIAKEGEYQALKQLKQHLYSNLDSSHPIYKISPQDILQKGYTLHSIKRFNNLNKQAYDTYLDLPVIFLLSGSVEIRCITEQAEYQTITQIEDKGLIEVNKNNLIQRFGQQFNTLTCFEVIAKQDTILIQIQSNHPESAMTEPKSSELTQQQKRELSIINKYMVIPSKQLTKLKISASTINCVKSKLYLLSGLACYFWESKSHIGENVILSCYTIGYLDPNKYELIKLDEKSTPKNMTHKLISSHKKPTTAQHMQLPSISSAQKSVKILKPLRTEQRQQQNIKQVSDNNKIKLIVFEGSEVICLEQEFVREEWIKSLQQKRDKHLQELIKVYQTLPKAKISKVQEQLISKYSLPRKIVNMAIYKIPESSKQVRLQGYGEKNVSKCKGRLNSTEKLNSRNELRSTASSVKGNIRIRKAKKL